MRLFTAIPLLFWVGTAAVAHFVHACAAVPVDVTGDLSTGEPSVETAVSGEAIVPGDAASVVVFTADPAREPALALAPAPPQAQLRTVREQVFASAELFANPPPSAA